MKFDPVYVFVAVLVLCGLGMAWISYRNALGGRR
jgi:hypothetical protein